MNAPIVTPPVDDEGDPLLLAAYRALDSVAPSPGLQPRAVILAAAERQAAFHAHRSLFQRPPVWVAIGLLLAASLAVIVLRGWR
jgi:hypothetical protein